MFFSAASSTTSPLSSSSSSSMLSFSRSIFTRWLPPLIYLLSGATATYLLLSARRPFWSLTPDTTNSSPQDQQQQQEQEQQREREGRRSPSRDLRRRNAIRRRHRHSRRWDRHDTDSGDGSVLASSGARGNGRQHPRTATARDLSFSIAPFFDCSRPIASLDYLERAHLPYGEYKVTTTDDRGAIQGRLLPSCLSSIDEVFLITDILDQEDAAAVRYIIEMAFLDHFLLCEFPPGYIIPPGTHQWDYLMQELMARGLSQHSIMADFSQFNSTDNFPALVRSRRVMRDYIVGPMHLPNLGFVLETSPPYNLTLSTGQRVFIPQDELGLHNLPSPSPSPSPSPPPPPRNLPTGPIAQNILPPEDQSQISNRELIQLLYHMTDDQAKRDGFVHRGVACNSCGIIPIKGVRYRCSNCIDFDLCESCESVQLHTRSHLFYKVRVPAPFLGNPRNVQPVIYPGKPSFLKYPRPRDLLEKLQRQFAVDSYELQALWEQFRCLANAEWAEDPNGTFMAIDRRTFDKCFVSNISSKPPPPNLIYDRIFAYYDSDGNGLIGFEEFVLGLLSLNDKSVLARCKRMFEAYDLDRDGYVERKDFLRIFRTYYSATKEVANTSVTAVEDEHVFDAGPRDIVMGSQPISAAFSVNVSHNASLNRHVHSRAGEGKSQSQHGDLEIQDGEGLFRENETLTGDRNEIVAENAVRSVYGSGNPGLRTRRFLRQNAHFRDEPNFIAFLAEQDAALVADGIESVDMDLFIRNFDPDQPEEYITEQDIVCALNGRLVRYEEVTDPIERARVQYVAAQRMDREEAESMNSLRRDGVEERWARRSFYTDEEDGSAMPPYYRSDEEEQQHQLQFNDDNENNKLDNDRDDVHDDVDDDYDAGNDYDRDNCNRDGGGGDDERAKNTKYRASGSSGGDGGGGGGGGDDDDALDAAEETSAIPPSPRSRSSSKVRFQDDVTGDEYETRSNTSSRSIPVGERWGGFEIPEIERDVGKEILYQMVQEGINELLNYLFKYKEDLVMEARRTRRQRRRWAKEIDEYVELSSQQQELRDYRSFALGLANGQVPFEIKADGYVTDYDVDENRCYYDEDGAGIYDDEEDRESGDSYLYWSYNYEPGSRMDYAIFPDQQPPAPAPAPEATLPPAGLSPQPSPEHLPRRGHDYDRPDIMLPQYRPNSSDLEAFSPVVSDSSGNGDDTTHPAHASLRVDENAVSSPSPAAFTSSHATPSSRVSTPPLGPASSSNDKENEQPPSPSPLTPPTTRTTPDDQQQQQQQQQGGGHHPRALPPRAPPSSVLARWHRLNQVEQEMAERGGSGAKLDMQEFTLRMQCDRDQRLAFLADWIDMNGF